MGAGKKTWNINLVLIPGVIGPLRTAPRKPKRRLKKIGDQDCRLPENRYHLVCEDSSKRGS